MGLLDRFRKSSAPAVLVELHPDALRDAEECHRTTRDFGHVTRGRGTARLISVAGTSHRQRSLEAVIAGRGGKSAVADVNLPAVVLRDPANRHDSNAIRVLVDGVHVGFIPAREIGHLQPLLRECERRGVLLVGSARLTGGAEHGWGAGIRVRPDLDGWESPVIKKPPAEKKPAPPSAVLLEGAELARVVEALWRLVNQRPVRTKQQAGLVVKQVRELLPALESHAEALEDRDEQRGMALGDEVDDIEAMLEDLRDAEDSDDQEDAHENLQIELEEVLNALDGGRA